MKLVQSAQTLQGTKKLRWQTRCVACLSSLIRSNVGIAWAHGVDLSLSDFFAVALPVEHPEP